MNTILDFIKYVLIKIVFLFRKKNKFRAVTYIIPRKYDGGYNLYLQVHQLDHDMVNIFLGIVSLPRQYLDFGLNRRSLRLDKWSINIPGKPHDYDLTKIIVIHFGSLKRTKEFKKQLDRTLNLIQRL